MVDLDILIPVRNEQDNISKLIKRIDRALTRNSIKYRIFFVDDHSTDETVYEIKKLRDKYPIKVYLKEGLPGKAYSIIEGAKKSHARYLCMIDGDLQYPPEAIPKMYKLIEKHGLIIANRYSKDNTFIRSLTHKAFKLIFGRILFNFDFDVQSGLKLFKREIIDTLDTESVSGWTIDLPLIRQAQAFGYKIAEVPINFYKRHTGNSKINIISSTMEIAIQSFRLKFLSDEIVSIPPNNSKTMIGAGFLKNNKKYITHTTLPKKESAVVTFTNGEKFIILALVTLLGYGLIVNPLLSTQIIIGALTIIYFLDVLFNLYLITRSLIHPPELNIANQDLNNFRPNSYPIYTILCPLYKEDHVINQFLNSIVEMKWPKEKLQVLLLLEENDVKTINAIHKVKLPYYVQEVYVPDSQPKTKPKACNFGLNIAKGEYLVIYDAEDKPDPYQLMKAFWSFRRLPEDVVCLQAKLNYYNPQQNLLTRLFTAEYSLWFDLILPALQVIDTVIPLGGTSNHFKTKILKDLKGWDPFNVTEDCDLGVRLFNKGYKTAIIESTTLEEANSKLKNWIRQRSRWIKGYIQTYLVQMRHPISLIKKQGKHAFIFQLIIGARISFMLINPFLWLTTASYFLFRGIVGHTIESLFPPVVFYTAIFSLLVGNFAYLYNYMIASVKKGHFLVVKYVYLIPFYWIIASISAFVAFYQLITKPFYWEKTIHGFHLDEEFTAQKESVIKIPTNKIPRAWYPALPRLNFNKSGLITSGSLFIAAQVIVHILNFVYNAYLGRALSIEQYGLISLFTSIFFVANIPLSSISQTILQKSAYLNGRFSTLYANSYLNSTVKNLLLLTLFSTFFWLISINYLNVFFKAGDIFPFLIFAPYFFFAFIHASTTGYLRGLLLYKSVAAIIVFGALTKLLLTIILVLNNRIELLTLAIPSSIFFELLLSLIFISIFRKQLKKNKSLSVNNNLFRFNYSFFISSFVSSIFTIIFVGLDLILARHYLNPTEAGQYALISLIGKTTFFAGSLITPFILPIISFNNGLEKKNNKVAINSQKVFLIALISTSLVCVLSMLAFGIYGKFTLPVFFGDKVSSILVYLPIFICSISVFTVSTLIVNFTQAKLQYIYSYASVITLVFLFFLVNLYHSSLSQFIWVIFATSLLQFEIIIIIFLLNRIYQLIKSVQIYRNNIGVEIK